MFITFEGLDFSGKTTQAKLLIEKLQQRGKTVHFIREPGGTRISERVREILLDKAFSEMTDTAELLLFSASRTQLVSEVIVPALKRSEVVVCDRYFDSTTVYQGHGRGLNLDAVKSINRLATGGLNPDLTILIDISIDEIERRKLSAGLAFDRMESSGKKFYERVRKGYIALAHEESNRFVHIDGMESMENVERNVWRSVEQRLMSHNVSQ
ncbi:MAG: dTMP kinase [Bacteroidota bacterium]